jgi:hypothetical protein
VKRSVKAPKYDWAGVDHNSVGVVSRISPDRKDVAINFPKHSNDKFWMYSIVREMIKSSNFNSSKEPVANL